MLMAISLIGLTIHHKKLQRNALNLKNQLENNTNKSNKGEELTLRPTAQQSGNTTASTAKTRYLSGISHELRTPLNVIMGYAQLLETQAVHDDPNRDKYTLMRHNCEHLSHLIEGILEFSAIEAGKLKVQFEVVELNRMLNQVGTMFKHQAEQKGIQFSSHIDAKLPSLVKTDHKRLQQILINLLSNAIKFTDEGQVSLNIKYRNQVATFVIKDNGCGIKDEDLHRIFEPFERIEHPNTPTQGTGLGLPITQMLVDLMGGELTVTSELGVGSEFTVKLMLAPLSHHQNTQPDASINQTTSASQQHNHLHHILVVDDERSHRDLLIQILSPHHFNVSTASDAEQAKNQAQNSNFSLAIIDVSMPEVNGWQLAAWFKLNSPHTKIMMLSANPRDTEASAERHYDVYLTKPIIVDALLNDINHLLKLNQQNKINHQEGKTYLKPIKLNSEHHSALLHMLEIGHINGIEVYLKKLHQQHIIDDLQYAHLKQPIEHMNLTAFKQMVGHEN